MTRPATPLVTEVRVRDFRTMADLAVELGPLSALVGEAQAGKSNLLAAIRSVLDPVHAPPVPADVRRGRETLAVRARLADGRWLSVAGRPPGAVATAADGHPPVLYLPARERAGRVVPGGPDALAGTPELERFAWALRRALHRRDRGSPASPALCAVEALAACAERGLPHVVLLVEEPELYLRPQAQRWLSHVLRRLAAGGTQVIYATHSPAFLNVARLDELVFIERRDDTGTHALRPPALTPDEDFRVLSEFDAERAELFLARAALLVEGETEKLALPFVFAALGHDADREGISIVECGGKANIVLFARVCRAAGVPFAVLYDRDAPAGRRPSAGNRELAAQIAAIAGPGGTVELAPDFEAVSHLRRGGHKPERAWRRFAQLPADRMPGELVRAVHLAVRLARGPGSGAIEPRGQRGHGLADRPVGPHERVPRRGDVVERLERGGQAPRDAGRGRRG